MGFRDELQPGSPAPEIVDLRRRQIECQRQFGDERVIAIVEARRLPLDQCGCPFLRILDQPDLRLDMI